jgi:hypothetical protein
MDTLFKLQKKKVEIPHLAKKVSQIIFDSTNTKNDSYALSRVAFPQGELELRGIEGNWRFGEDAWLMQSILMARLIGRAFWKYTLQSLEQDMTPTRSGQAMIQPERSKGNSAIT